MALEHIQRVLLWCAVINYAVLILWFGVFAMAHGWLYRLHGRWFKVPAASFDTMHYAGMAMYKIQHGHHFCLDENRYLSYLKFWVFSAQM